MTVQIEAPFVGTGSVYVVQVGRTTVFGTWDGTANYGQIGSLAAEAMADAIVRAATQATGAAGIPAVRDLKK